MTSELKPRILLIDDDRLAHERFRNLIGDHYQLHSAYGGEDGLASAVSLMPDLILLDVMMPGIDGLTVCGNLRAHPLVCDIPIIMLTALDDQETRLKSMVEGADEFLNKPFNELEMSLRLKNLLQINRYRRLQNERARTQWLLDSAQDAFLILDDQLNIEYANHRACSVFDLTQPAGFGEPINFQTTLSEFHSESCGLWNKWLSNPTGRDFNRIHLLRQATPTRPAKAFVMRTHVYEVRSRASILVQLTEVTKEAQSLSLCWNFQHHVAHKLFTPITGIKGGLEMLEETAAGKLDMIEADALQVAIKSSARLLADCRRVVEYLDLTRAGVASGSFPMNDIDALCGDIWKSAGVRMAVCDLDAKLWNRALSIPEIPLAAILTELTNNSRKFTESGTPRITLRIVESPRNTAVFHFSDEGLGIPPEQLADVWLPYFQAEKTFTGSVPGMGLGLSSVALQVWQAGGAFAIKNNDFGKGVTVTLEIPLVSVTASGKTRPQPLDAVADGPVTA